MKAAIISLGSVSSRRIKEALEKYFDKVDAINLKEIEVSLGGAKAEVLYQGKPLPKYDCIHTIGSYKYANLLRSVTTILGPTCYMPLRASSLTIGHSKLLTHLKLQAAEVPMPATYLAATADAAKNLLKKITYPVIMKLPTGTHGKGVMYAESIESASSMIDALALLNQPFILQEYIETGGTDTRAFVIGDKVVATMKRKAAVGEVRANIHAGAQPEATMLDAKTKKIAIRAARAIKADICAVDILESAKGPLVLEVNVSPGLQGIQKVTKIDIADAIAKYLYENTMSENEQEKVETVKEMLPEPGQEVMTNLDFRGERILLPEIATKLSGFKEEDEFILKIDKGQIVIKKE